MDLSGLTLALSSSEGKPGGVFTPAVGLGIPLLERLLATGTEICLEKLKKK
jgi:hypothetical protein